MGTWIILAVLAGIVIYAISLYNTLVKNRQMAGEGWSGIDVQLKRRADLIPNLLESVKGYMTHETRAPRRGHPSAQPGRGRKQRFSRTESLSRRCAQRRARTADGGCGKLSGSQGQRELQGIPGGAGGNRKRDLDVAPLLQWCGTQSQRLGGKLPLDADCQDSSVSSRRNTSRSRTRPTAPFPKSNSDRRKAGPSRMKHDT
jgi:hypothetical protein